jgi:hypothetical protein
MSSDAPEHKIGDGESFDRYTSQARELPKLEREILSCADDSDAIRKLMQWFAIAFTKIRNNEELDFLDLVDQGLVTDTRADRELQTWKFKDFARRVALIKPLPVRKRAGTKNFRPATRVFVGSEELDFVHDEDLDLAMEQAKEYELSVRRTAYQDLMIEFRTELHDDIPWDYDPTDTVITPEKLRKEWRINER